MEKIEKFKIIVSKLQTVLYLMQQSEEKRIKYYLYCYNFDNNLLQKLWVDIDNKIVSYINPKCITQNDEIINFQIINNIPFFDFMDKYKEQRQLQDIYFHYHNSNLEKKYITKLNVIMPKSKIKLKSGLIKYIDFSFYNENSKCIEYHVITKNGKHFGYYKRDELIFISYF